MTAGTGPALHELLDDGFAPAECAVLVVGCGNILAGDDAVGPILIRHLWERGVPTGVRIVDGGTAGMDVAFQMRGARRVVVVDASATGAAPGTIYRVPGDELADLPPLDGLHTHSFRWDHALAFSRWMLGPEYPTDVTVFLIEAENVAVGAEMSPSVAASMNAVCDLIETEFFPEDADVAEQAEPAGPLEITELGYLHVPAATAARFFPSSVCGLMVAGDHGTTQELLLVPLNSESNGGQVLKQRNSAGDRSLLVRESLDDDLPVGRYLPRWDGERGALVIDLPGMKQRHERSGEREVT